MNYYNDVDPFAAAWLRELIADGLIPAGDVDERSITDVTADDVRGYTQCHFFAGIAGWSLALQFAGWPDDRPVWTGSCPCPSFSVAGKGSGFKIRATYGHLCLGSSASVALSASLASGVSNRVGALRGAGNSITVQTAAEFVMAAMEIAA